MSLKTRWLISMLGVVLAGTALTTLISSSISFYGSGKAAYEWLSASHRRANASFNEQLFAHLEAQAQLLSHLPALADSIAARRSSGLQEQMSALSRLPKGSFWAVLGTEGGVISTNHRACLEKPRLPLQSPTGSERSFLMCGRIPALAV